MVEPQIEPEPDPEPEPEPQPKPEPELTGEPETDPLRTFSYLQVSSM